MPLSIGNTVVAFHNNLGQRMAVSIGDTLVDSGMDAPAPDMPGTLTVSVDQVGRNFNFTFSVSDPNGIRSLTSAVLTSRDSRTADVLSDFSRSDANTFSGTDSRRNARWSSGSLGVVYVDAVSGNSHTLLETFSV